jgi:hypothetical protein
MKIHSVILVLLQTDGRREMDGGGRTDGRTDRQADGQTDRHTDVTKVYRRHFLRLFVDIASKKDRCNTKKQKQKRKLGRNEKEEEYAQSATTFCHRDVTKL